MLYPSSLRVVEFPWGVKSQNSEIPGGETKKYGGISIGYENFLENRLFGPPCSETYSNYVVY